MEKAILNLEREFQRLVGELEFHAHRLEKDWGSDFNGKSHNPIKLFKRLKGLERQLPDLQKQHRANTQAKQEAVACLPQMVGNMQVLASLKQSIGFVDDAVDAREADGAPALEDECRIAEELVQAWKDEISAGREGSNAFAAAGFGNADAAGAASAAASGAAVLADATAAVNAAAGATTAVPVILKQKLTGAAKMQAWEVLDAQEFECLPASVRGRCKAKDVAKAYALIRAHFEAFLVHNINAAKGVKTGKKKVKKAAPLTIAALSNQGGKVTGYTGECVLNSLRQLDLIDVDFKSGRVTVAKAK